MTTPSDDATAELVQVMDDLDQLRADYPNWQIDYMAPANLPWEAKRLPFQMPRTGGFSWLSADTADRLRDLIGGALQIEHQAATEDSERRPAP